NQSAKVRRAEGLTVRQCLSDHWRSIGSLSQGVLQHLFVQTQIGDEARELAVLVLKLLVRRAVQ
ncbi:MAG: hypothetical protein AAF416_19955, partial [Pseudomonadota bacterium]